jgi:formylmethanofuran dehydrogenase subunit D
MRFPPASTVILACLLANSSEKNADATTPSSHLNFQSISSPRHFGTTDRPLPSASLSRTNGWFLGTAVRGGSTGKFGLQNYAFRLLSVPSNHSPLRFLTLDNEMVPCVLVRNVRERDHNCVDSAVEEEEEDAQKEPSKASPSRKKKKKKKAADGTNPSGGRSSSTSSTSSSSPPSKPNSKVDLSMAILTGSADRNAMRVFSYSSEEGHSVVGMTEAAMEKMGLFEGDSVSIKGKRGRKTMASVATLDEGDVTALSDGSSSTEGGDGTAATAGAIGMSADAMKNAGVRAGDRVSVTAAPSVKFGKSVVILPTAEALKLAGITDATAAASDVKIFDDYLKPYFDGKFRILYRGDRFHIAGPAGELEFACVEIDSVEEDDAAACVVVEDTVIEFDGEPVESE